MMECIGGAVDEMGKRRVLLRRRYGRWTVVGKKCVWVDFCFVALAYKVGYQRCNLGFIIQ